MIDVRTAQRFLTEGRVAVVGASDTKGNFGATVVKALAEHGVDVVAVNPQGAATAGCTGYASLADVPAPVSCVVVMVPASAAGAVVHDAVKCGVRRVWLFRGVGSGAVSDDVLSQCQAFGLEVIPGACPLMFLDPVKGVHRFHRMLRRDVRRVPVTAAS